MHHGGMLPEKGAEMGLILPEFHHFGAFSEEKTGRRGGTKRLQNGCLTTSL